MPPPVGSSSGGCPAVWSISHHRGYCSCESTVRLPHPCARAAGPACLAGDPLLGCVPASLSSVAFMAPSDVCHGRRCSLAGPGPVALEYRSCHWPGGSAGLPQCIRHWGCRPLLPVPLLPSVYVRVRCPGPLGACSPVCALCTICVCCWWSHPSSSSPPNFVFFSFFFSVFVLFCLVYFFFENEKGVPAHCRQRHGQLVQRCNSMVFTGVRRWCFVGSRAPGMRLTRLDVHGYGSG